MTMQCDDARLKVQALADGELPEDEIAEVMDHVQSCYRCRDDYVELLRLQRKMQGLVHDEPAPEWFEKLHRKVGRKVGSSTGQVLFIGSYVALVAYAFYSLFADGGAGLFIKIAAGGILVGVLALLGVTISDRWRESKDDRYKGVMK